MSYASSVKEELAGQVPAARHCKIAEIAAIVGYDDPLYFSRHHQSVRADRLPGKGLQDQDPDRKSGSCEKVLYIIKKNI